jgi:hypothetical protein
MRTYPLDFKCPECRAKPGKQCVGRGGYWTLVPHASRIERAMRAGKRLMTSRTENKSTDL